MTELDAWATVRPLAWNDSSRAVLHDALARATPRPWAVDLGDQEVVFREPPGGQALDSAALYRCGAALAAAWTVLRVLGHDLVAEFPGTPGQLAVLRVVGRSSPADQDWRRYAAIRDLTAPGTVLTPAPPAALQAIVDDSAWPETELAIVEDSTRPKTELAIADVSALPVAKLAVVDNDAWPATELAIVGDGVLPVTELAIVDDGAWPVTEPASVGDGAWSATEPALVRPQWPFAPASGESAVLVLTNGAARRHYVLAGAAVHQARLSAAASGFGTEVITGPRARAVAETAALPGLPHALLRFGTPG
ncbi:hypothetical protein OG943_06370 [Amycolatopsis sp. NBC_00345]|uniref:hypothetical protein n=1 Tax=Amycolatopsis sp. NBC_00345 TaxID=2975955 RepID=UPI002E276C70